MGFIAILVLSALVVGEACIIYGLLNRVLAQAKVAPLDFLPERKEPEPPRVKERPIFSVPITG